MKIGIVGKLVILCALVGLSMIPLVVIWGVVAERARYRDRVVADVGQTSARAQLLFVSLSEHLAFATAYVVASGACVGLLVFYSGYVLGGLSRALGFGVFLASLYVLLYVILLSEDYALLLGSLLLFATLSAVMIATRRVDWYRLGEEGTSAR